MHTMPPFASNQELQEIPILLPFLSSLGLLYAGHDAHAAPPTVLHNDWRPVQQHQGRWN